MEEANLPEGVLEAIRIAVAAAFRVEKEARDGDVGIASGARGVEVATEVGGVGGADRDGGVIGQTSGASNMRRGRSRSPTSRRRSRHGRSGPQLQEGGVGVGGRSLHLQERGARVGDQDLEERTVNLIGEVLLHPLLLLLLHHHLLMTMFS
jgi:hypothetical protein